MVLYFSPAPRATSAEQDPQGTQEDLKTWKAVEKETGQVEGRGTPKKKKKLSKEG